MDVESGDTIDTCAKDRFGLTYLYPYQRLVITNILTAVGDTEQPGRQIVLLPTGAGKSLCFQLPAALIAGATCVVYPLIGLMNDQERRISDAGFSVVQLRGGQSGEERREAAKRIVDGDVDFVLTNPETLAGQKVRATLGTADIAHLVVDEAHCVSEWGDTFRSAYLTLGESIRTIAPKVVTAFTATASDRVIQRIREVVFPEGGAHLIRGNADRENITYTVQPTLSKRHTLRFLAVQATTDVEERSSGGVDRAPRSTELPVWNRTHRLPLPAIVFCRTRTETEAYAAVVATAIGRERSFFYHAGLSKERKDEIERGFFSAEDAILCATCAYGMGVDKSNVRAVVHTYIPDTVEAYLQESGRGGRDRAPAYAIVLVDISDLETYRRLTVDRHPHPVAQAVFGTTCRRAALLKHLGVTDSACTGCDRCATPTVAPISPALELLSEVFRQNRHGFCEDQWIRLLRGRLADGDIKGGYHKLPWVGMLARWSMGDVEEALSALTDAGVLAEKGFPLSPIRRLVPHALHRQERGRTDRHQPSLPFEIEER